jgi:hypothetical protein
MPMTSDRWREQCTMPPELPSSGTQPRPTPGVAALIETVDRLERLIDAETMALRHFKAVDLRDFNNRKSQILLELTRTIKALNGARLDPPVMSRLSAVREKLAANQALLATHLKAAKTITTIVADAIRDNESDGTYSNSAYGTAERW